MGALGVMAAVLGVWLLAAVDPAAVDWPFVALSSLLGVVFNFLINFGIAFTYPLFISIGTVVGVPLAILLDFALSGALPTSAQLGGSGLVVLGFVCLLIADLFSRPMSAGLE